MERTFDHNTDWRRVATASSFGIGFVGPVGHFWYAFLLFTSKECHKFKILCVSAQHTSKWVNVQGWPKLQIMPNFLVECFKKAVNLKCWNNCSNFWTTSIFDNNFMIARYEALESVCINRLKLKPNSFRFITTKVMADTFLFGPVHLLAFFTYTGLASGKPWDEVKHDVKRDFLPSYMTEGLGWAIVQVSVSLWLITNWIKLFSKLIIYHLLHDFSCKISNNHFKI